MLKSFLGYLRGTERIGLSTMGNPTYRLIMEGVDGTFMTFRTMSNAGFAYGITNPEFKDQLLRLELTKAGRVRSVELVVPL